MTEDEIALLHNSDFFILKRQITEKLVELLGKTEKRIRKLDHLFSEVETLIQPRGKISKGENYRGLPYLVLDSPAHFSKESVFAVRTMIWWGKEASCTVHLSGKFLRNIQNRLQEKLIFLSEKGYSISVNSTPWEYHYGKDNYILISELEYENARKKVLTDSFIKISKPLPLSKIELLPEFSENVITDILG